MAYQMTFNEAEELAQKQGIDLSHECDESAPQCVCCHCDSDGLQEGCCHLSDPDNVPFGGHAAGDARCPMRPYHTICSHDARTLRNYGFNV